MKSGSRESDLVWFVDTYFPDTYRWMKLLHLDHVLLLNSRMRLVLLLCCVISLGFSFTWLSDLWHLTCFSRMPWTERGLARFTCAYQAVGSVVFLLMFRHAALAFAFYDSKGEALWRKKQQFMTELRQQCQDVLLRATKRAGELTGLLSVELGQQIKDHIKNMRTILEEEDINVDPHRRLAIAMASHLHDLRQPALFYFHKLIPLARNSFLQEELEREQRESMVQLLKPNIPRANLPRSETVDQELLLPDFRNITNPGRVCHCLSWLFPSQSSQLPSRFRLPTRQDLAAVLREVTPEDRNKIPEYVVLQPVNLVLKWFEKLEFLPDDGQGHGRPGEADSRDFLYNLEHSGRCRCLLLGTVFCFGYFIFYAITLRSVTTMLAKGECFGSEMQCLIAVFRKTFGLLAMALYIGSMSIVILNIERLDRVLQLQMEIAELQDFKSEIDQLNAYAFSKEDTGISMISQIAAKLHTKKDLIDDFVREGFKKKRTMTQDDFIRLAKQLESDLPRTASVSSPRGHRGDREEHQPLMMGPMHASAGEP